MWIFSCSTNQMYRWKGPALWGQHSHKNWIGRQIFPFYASHSGELIKKLRLLNVNCYHWCSVFVIIILEERNINNWMLVTWMYVCFLLDCIQLEKLHYRSGLSLSCLIIMLIFHSAIDINFDYCWYDHLFVCSKSCQLLVTCSENFFCFQKNVVTH